MSKWDVYLKLARIAHSCWKMFYVCSISERYSLCSECGINRRRSALHQRVTGWHTISFAGNSVQVTTQA